MRRMIGLFLAVVMVGALSTAPAGADVDDNPNAVPFGPVICENGLEFGLVHLPNGATSVGHVSSSNVVGVAKRLWLASEDGQPIAPIDPPLNSGLASLTVFCYWPSEGSPTGYIGGDILFRQPIR